MEYVFTVLGLFALAFWFIRGMFSRRLDERDKELQRYYENLSDNRKADDLLNDPERRKRVRDYFND